MRHVFVLQGYIMIFVGFLVGLYDTIISTEAGSNQFHSVWKLIDYLNPGFVNPFRFGFHGKEFIWTDIITPMFGFLLCLLMLLIGLVMTRLKPPSTLV